MQGLIIDSDTLATMLTIPSVDPSQRPMLVREVEARVAKIKAGVDRYPHLDRALQLAFEDNLRTRLDFDHDDRLIIERYSPEATCWLKVMDWPQDHEGKQWSVEEVIAKMYESDMRRWKTPMDYKRHKDEMAAKVRAANTVKANEKMREAFTSLGKKRLDNFVEVEKAMLTGERITAHGECLQSIERMVKSSANHERMVALGLERGADLARRWGMQLIGVDDKGNPVLQDPKSSEVIQ